jgi:hypothetical protein
MQPVTLTMDAESLLGMLTGITDELPPAIIGWVDDAAVVTTATEKEHASVGVTGDLKESITYDLVPESLSASVGPTANYAAPVEYGSKPHWAPIEPLKAWAALKGMNPYALRWSIAQKGTLPHPYVEPTYEEVEPLIGILFSDGMRNLLARFAV